MNKLREYLKTNIMIADGASGTYISSIAGRTAAVCELLNLQDPEAVLRMHRQYVKAGAKLIFTNTFGASLAGTSIGGSFETTRKILFEGVRLARLAAGHDAFVAADIGPLPETSVDSNLLDAEYRRIADAFLEAGVENFVFETFASAYHPIRVARYIKSRLPDAFILISFAVLPDGYSREGVSGQRLIDGVKAAGCADAAGFNCCSGPAHLLNYATTVDYGELLPTIMPNAGYPQRETDDAQPADAGVTYSGSPDYFAARLSAAARHGFRIIGGCCGTTPRHIAFLAQAVFAGGALTPVSSAAPRQKALTQARVNGFEAALARQGRKAVIVELEPPINTDVSKITNAARLLAQSGVDAVTIADSPMARARADSMTIAARLYRETGLEVIPHLCCRDKNINGIKSTVIAGHIEGIRNLLAVTGDPVPDTDRGTVKSVFNLNSEGLCRFINSLNDDVFSGDPILCGCAFNVNARNLPAEIARLEKKLAAGARFVLTQPVFTPEAATALEGIRKSGVRVLCGILSPVSYKNAVFLANEMPGFSIPDQYLKRFSPDMTREEGEDTGVAIAVEIAKSVADLTDGYYLIVPFNRVHVVRRIIEILRQDGIL